MSVDLSNLPSKTRMSLEKLSEADFIKNFYLAGGTAVALFLNHRRSDDLDFFSEKEFRTPTLIKNLKRLGSFKGLKSAENTLIGELNGIKISFFTLPYKLLETPLKYNKLRIARFLDLAAMKILAISDRGVKRDFIDLYFLCQKVKPLDELLCFFQKKFGKYDHNIYHIIKSLTYFEEAEIEETPNMYIRTNWKTVKNFFEKEKVKLAKKFLRI
jgi:predicted nucleotidyltransferase component of viral defense system